MNYQLSKPLTAAAMALALVACGSDSSSSTTGENNVNISGDTQTYRITFEQTWNRTDFPTNFPSSAHFSPLIGASHSSQIIIWRPNDQPTSPGMEVVAETGATSSFRQELQTAQGNGYVNDIFVNGSAPRSPGSQTQTFVITEQFPLVSAISMLAPSPDWFVGVRDVNLRVNGEWVERLVFDLRLYDAGTESGERFSLSNPAGGDRTITLVTTDSADTDFANGVHRSSGEFVGRMIIERQ